MAFPNRVLVILASVTLVVSFLPPAFAYSTYVRFRCNNKGWLFVNGKHAIDVHGADKVAKWEGPLVEGDQILIKGVGPAGNAGCSAEITYRTKDGHIRKRFTDTTHWKALSAEALKGGLKHILKRVPTSSWPKAVPGARSVRLSPRARSIFAGSHPKTAFLWTQLGAGPVSNPPGQVLARKSPPSTRVRFRCNNKGWLFVNGKHATDVHGAEKVATWEGPLVEGDQILIKGVGPAGNAGCTAEITYSTKAGHIRKRLTDTKHWKALPAGSLDGSLEHILKRIPTSSWLKAVPGARSVRLSSRARSIFAGSHPRRAFLWTQLGAGPVSNPPGQVLFNCDDHGWLFINKRHVRDVHGATNIAVWTGKLSAGDEVVIKGRDDGGGYGCNALVHYFDGGHLRATTTSTSWKALPLTEEEAKTGSAVVLARKPLEGWAAADKGTYGKKIVDKAVVIWGSSPHGSAFVGTKLPSSK